MKALRKGAYEAYINSDGWRETRARYRKERPWQCAVCRTSVNLHLHHKTYKRLGRERLDDLIPLCEYHHSAAHELVRAGKTQLWNAHAKVIANTIRLAEEPRQQKKQGRKKKGRYKSLKITYGNKRDDQVWCERCHILYPPKHPKLRCECGGYIVFRRKAA